MIGVLFGKRLWVSVLEILLVISFSQIPIALNLTFYLASLTDDKLSVNSVIDEIFSSYTLADIFIFVTGVVGSAMAFFLINYGILRRKPTLAIYCIAVPLIILFFSTPIFISDRINANPPNAFSTNFAIFVLMATMINWLVIVYEKNFEFEPDENAERNRLKALNAAINQIFAKGPQND